MVSGLNSFGAGTSRSRKGTKFYLSRPAPFLQNPFLLLFQMSCAPYRTGEVSIQLKHDNTRLGWMWVYAAEEEQRESTESRVLIHCCMGYLEVTSFLPLSIRKKISKDNWDGIHPQNSGSGLQRPLCQILSLKDSGCQKELRIRNLQVRS